MARRRTGWRRRWLTAAASVAALAAATPAAQPPVPAAPEKIHKDKSVQMPTTPAPTIDVLDYLALYPEAGDGFDPLGLADGEMAAGSVGGDEHKPEKQR